LSVCLPFVREEYEAAVAAMGEDYWAYGIEPNRQVLSTFARYATAQHLIAAPSAPEDLFAEELGEDVII
jgi:4,5-dihydroxyphthalate decarboxylase